MQFLLDFIGRRTSVSDLYAVDVKTRAIRQLTDFPAGVIPEFFWNRDHTKIIFTVIDNGAGGAGARRSYVGRFDDITARQHSMPESVPAPGLAGRGVDMARVGAQAQMVRNPRPVDNASVAAVPPSHPAPGFPHAAVRVDHPSIPAVTATYLGVWLGDLAELDRRGGETFARPPLLAAVGQFGG